MKTFNDSSITLDNKPVEQSKDDDSRIMLRIENIDCQKERTEHDDEEAMIKLGNCYEKRIGVPVDDAATTHRQNKLIRSMQEIVLSINELAQRYATAKHSLTD